MLYGLSSEYAYIPKRVIQILSGSRTGSSLLAKVLSKSPSLTALDGEEEPYIKLSGNGYGMSSSWEGGTEFVNTKIIRRCINTELARSFNSSKSWSWRLQFQFPTERLAPLINALPDRMEAIIDDRWLQKMNIQGYYDGCEPGDRKKFSFMTYEMMPFVKPTQYCGNRTLTDTLLLKCPYNLYRPGLMESVFPEAEFTYIFLVRNPASTINGLIDAWESPFGFFKHQLPDGRWWCFDLIQDWTLHYSCPVAIKCHLQWLYAHATIAVDPRYKDTGGHLIRFEDFLVNPEAVIGRLCRRLEIEPPAITGALPLVMATTAPKKFRWQEKQNTILPLLEDNQTKTVIQQLEYGDRSEWI